MSDSTGTGTGSSPNTEKVESREEVIGEIDPEWERYWNEQIDNTIVAVGLLVLELSLLKSGYPDEVKDKITKRIKRLIRRYDAHLRREKRS